LHEDLASVVPPEVGVLDFELHRAELLAVVDQAGRSEFIESCHVDAEDYLRGQCGGRLSLGTSWRWRIPLGCSPPGRTAWS